MRDGYVKARITWLTPEEGGRQHLIGSRYAGAASFDGIEDQWSFFITNYEDPDEAHTHYVDMTLLVREKSSEILTPGRLFEAYEGSRLVATGEVIA